MTFEPFFTFRDKPKEMLIMIIRTVTMDDLNEVVELESDAFKMTKKQTEQDMIGRIENYPDTFF